MIAGCYAREYTYDLPYRYQQIFRIAEDSARAYERGFVAEPLRGSTIAQELTRSQSGCGRT
ncbi:hypothetical protein [Mycobacterium sp. ITM-2016-00318]|uniref:hypothetical protein n=1 Tax=Mycobacterium sp. ITM-2016-00318 TaxID=2099693 RepID=UPI000CF87E14|nr:hypothetical protein [Mycobacterium sp. ITM-2016-00318]WNG93590.1 hypothetical protein C6A82_003705 [Mycobacterium sp. ITM-2016-00318]